MICGVIIDKEAKELNKEFDYNIPKSLEDVVTIGVRVKVPFRNTVVLGYVISIKEKSEFSKLKNVIECLDIIPSFTEEMIEIAKNISKSTASFISTCLNQMIPSAIKAKYKKTIKVIDSANFIDGMDYNDVSDLKLLKKEILDHKVEILYDFEDKSNKKEEVYVIQKDFTYSPKTNNEKEVLNFLKYNQCIKRSVLNKEVSLSTVNNLEKKKVIEFIKKEEYRKPLSNPYYKKVDLNDEQKDALNEIDLKNPSIYLIHGITGSGKTEIYLELIEETIKTRNVIFLVPEISLTPMFSNRLIGRFNDNVAVIHSKLSDGEKYDEYRRIQRGEVKIVVGPRSAIFSPIKNVGLIIIDEEHEDSYIQDVNPKYNAIEVAKFRAKYNNSTLILGSATPNVCHYKEALDSKIKLVELKNRALGKMPKCELVDMKNELLEGNKSIFSKSLISKISDRLKNKEQTILFLNRRGFSSFLLCRSCGYVVKCKNCDISLTYHKEINKLRCHYCGYEQDILNTCPECSSNKIKFMGIGTEKVQEEVRNFFKDARVLRMDTDTVSKKNSSEAILDSFKKGEADILIGTQMIAKGLDFENVTLVGVLNADLTLKLPGYKMAEKTFDLISQVSGRAGRHKDNGEVVIQGYDIDNYAIKTAVKSDYNTFYNYEIMIRKIASYPPFSIMKRIIFESNNDLDSYNEAFKIKNRFNEVLPDVEVLGPTKCDVSRIKNIFRNQIVLKYHNLNVDDYLFKMVEFYKDKSISINIDEM